MMELHPSNSTRRRGICRVIWNEWTRLVLVVFCTVYFLCSWSPTLSRCGYPRLEFAVTEAENTSNSNMNKDTNVDMSSLALMCDLMTNHTFTKHQRYIQPAAKCNSYSYEAIMVSPGGVGSSTLFRNLTRNVGMKSINNEDDIDELKHAIYPVEMERIARLFKEKNYSADNCATKMFIYTYNQAAAAVFSLYRRDYHLDHNIKLRVAPFPEKCFPENIGEYVNSGIDFMGLEDHFISYLMGGLCWSDVPVVFLRSNYRHNEDASKAVVKMLRILNEHQGEIDVESLQPDIKELEIEESHYAKEEETREDFLKLQKFYADFQKKVDSLGYMSIFFRNKYLRLV